MKKIKIFFPILLVLAFSISSPKAKAQVNISVNFQTFYDDLSPYGTWISYPQYGYVWQPRVGRGFHPYRTSGHWVWSDQYQWIWVSDYDWGWAPFHYGRWHYDSYYGWIWVPDYEWSPAWVVWRGGGDYYGWAPMDAGISISIAFGNYSPSYDYWSFVPRRYITSPSIYNYYVSPQQNTTIINNTTVINNYSTSGGPSRNTFVSGPQRTEVERYTSQKLSPVRLSETTKPGRTRATNNQVSIYKPRVNAADKSSAKPSKVITADKANKTNDAQRNQPARNETQKNQPTKTQSQKDQPVRNEPQRTKPVRTEPQRNQPVRNEPQRNQPVRTEPQRNQPVRTEPQRTQPVRTEPQRNQPVRTEPQRSQPHNNPPGQSQQPKKKGKG